MSDKETTDTLLDQVKTRLVDRVAAITGLPANKLQEHWEFARENHRRLEACGFHVFEAIPDDRRHMRCKNCGGYIGLTDYSWFMTGLHQGRTGTPNP